jgi:hypothetical protein
MGVERKIPQNHRPLDIMEKRKINKNHPYKRENKPRQRGFEKL